MEIETHNCKILSNDFYRCHGQPKGTTNWFVSPKGSLEKSERALVKTESAPSGVSNVFKQSNKTYF